MSSAFASSLATLLISASFNFSCWIMASSPTFSDSCCITFILSNSLLKLLIPSVSLLASPLRISPDWESTVWVSSVYCWARSASWSNMEIVSSAGYSDLVISLMTESNCPDATSFETGAVFATNGYFLAAMPALLELATCLPWPFCMSSCKNL